jgi:hypothetical protein
MQRLEDAAVGFLAHNIDRVVDTPEFIDYVRSSAQSIRKRQETDSIPLIDDIRGFIFEEFGGLGARQSLPPLQRDQLTRKLMILEDVMNKLGYKGTFKH